MLLYLVENKQKNQRFIFGTAVALLVGGVGDFVDFGIINFCRIRLINIMDQVPRTDFMFEIHMCQLWKGVAGLAGLMGSEHLLLEVREPQ